MFANTGFPAILLPAIARFYFTLETCLQYIQFVQLCTQVYEKDGTESVLLHKYPQDLWINYYIKRYQRRAAIEKQINRLQAWISAIKKKKIQ